MKHLHIVIAATLGSVLATFSVFADNFALINFGLATGGGTGSGGNYSLTQTPSPSAATPMTGGNFSMTTTIQTIGGVVQTPGAPTLAIQSAGHNFVLSWPAAAAGFHLEFNNDLTKTNAWASVLQPPVTNNGIISVTAAVAPGNNFYRLHKPPAP